MNLKIKLLDPAATVPVYAHEDDACFDLVAVERVRLEPGIPTLIRTGISVDVQPGWVMLIFGRSGLALQLLSLSNCVGVIDPGYHGEVKVMLTVSGTSRTVITGDRIAQAMLIERPKVSFDAVTDFDESERGQGGFGSTGQ
jgi:dUTP pyrophosphatase